MDNLIQRQWLGHRMILDYQCPLGMGKTSHEITSVLAGKLVNLRGKRPPEGGNL